MFFFTKSNITFFTLFLHTFSCFKSFNMKKYLPPLYQVLYNSSSVPDSHILIRHLYRYQYVSFLFENHHLPPSTTLRITLFCQTYCAVHKFGHFGLKFDYPLFRPQKNTRTEKRLLCPVKPLKPSLQGRRVTERVQSVRRSKPMQQ